MGKFFQLDGGLMQFLTKVSDVVLTSILWLIFCLPLVTIGASTTAAYYTVVKVVRRQIGTMHREFFRSFKMNLKDSLIFGVIYLVMEAILAFNVYSGFRSMEETKADMAFYLMFFYAVLFLLVIAHALYLYPALSRFVMKRSTLMKFALFAMFRHFPTTLALLALFLVSFVLMVLLPIGILVMPGICLYLYSCLMERILWKYMSEEMRAAWKEPEEAVQE